MVKCVSIEALNLTCHWILVFQIEKQSLCCNLSILIQNYPWTVECHTFHTSPYVFASTTTIRSNCLTIMFLYVNCRHTQKEEKEKWPCWWNRRAGGRWCRGWQRRRGWRWRWCRRGRRRGWGRGFKRGESEWCRNGRGQGKWGWRTV